MKKAFTFLASAGLLAGSLLITGCGEESAVKQEETVTTPGGETTVTKETKVEKSGDHADDATTTTAPAETPATTPETPPAP